MRLNKGLIKTRMVHVILTAFLLVVSGLILSGNLLVWKRAEVIIRTLPDDVSQESVPDNFPGTYILRNGFNEYRMLKSEIKDLKNK